MKNIKKMITAATMMMVLMVGTSFGGIILTSAQQPQPCTVDPATTSKGGVILSDVTGTGIILTSVTGIILTSVTGIIIKSLSSTECGIIIKS